MGFFGKDVSVMYQVVDLQMLSMLLFIIFNKASVYHIFKFCIQCRSFFLERIALWGCEASFRVAPKPDQCFFKLCCYQGGYLYMRWC